MKQLLNTLYVTSEDAYLSLKNDNVIVQQGDVALGQIPLRSLESIVSFSYKGASPALMQMLGIRSRTVVLFPSWTILLFDTRREQPQRAASS